MHGSVFFSAIEPRQSSILNIDTTARPPRNFIARVIVRDHRSGQKFLVDTGADISVIPSTPNQIQTTNNKDTPTLFAANGSPIATFGSTKREINLGLRRKLSWEFIIAQVNQPIIGIDFLRFYNLLVDAKNNKLIDACTRLETDVVFSDAKNDPPSITTIDNTQRYSEILREFIGITRFSPNPPQSMANVRHHIETTGQPVFARARRLDPAKLRAAMDEFNDLVEKGICRPSKSNWSSPLHMVRKANGDYRPCGDYRALNAKTRADRYPIAFIGDFTHFLHGKKLFSVIDLRKAFHQIPINEDDIPKTAIITPFGLFEFTRMTFGLCNAAQTFQRFMHEVLKGLDFVFTYLDDIFVASINEIQHRQHLRALFQRLQMYGLCINTDKCQFGKTEIKFLGHLVTPDGIKPTPEKVDAIQNFPQPTSAKQLKRFLAMLNFYRRFLPKAVESQRILQVLIVGNRKNDNTVIEWTETALRAFASCKQQLANAALLAHPKPNADLALFTDASDEAVGAALNQRENDEWQPLAFYSKKLTDTQRKYSAYDRELVGVYQSVKHFRDLLMGRQFTIYTDHKPITFAFTQKAEKTSPRQIRQLDFISQFTTDIRHVSGTNNVVADSLSRINAIDWKDKINFNAIAEAQLDDSELQQLLAAGNSGQSNEFKTVNIPDSQLHLTCNVAENTLRPFVPKQFREAILTKLHGISHPGIKATTHMIVERYFWPNMKADCARFVKHCIPCQRCKVGRHNQSPFASFELATDRFQHVNIDIVGPLSISKDQRYVLTCIDRFSRWPVAIPITNITAETIARNFISGWIAQYGVPLRITSDLGRQFESSIFAELTRILGIDHFRTTPYHPQSNGMIERWHRTVKAAIKCHDNVNWTETLPFVMLGLRAAIKEDIGASPAELLYGTTLRLPGEFLCNDSKFVPQNEFVKDLRNTMQSLRPTTPSQHRNQKPFVHRELSKCSHVFVRIDAVRRPLQPPYNGPYRVLKRHDKYFTIDMQNRHAKISIDRLKPAFYTADGKSQDDSPALTNDSGNGGASEIWFEIDDDFISPLPCTSAQAASGTSTPQQTTLGLSAQCEANTSANSQTPMNRTVQPTRIPRAPRRVRFEPIRAPAIPPTTRSGRSVRRPDLFGSVYYR